MHTRTVHGLRDKKAWDRKLDEIHRMEDMARLAPEGWTDEDQEWLRQMAGES